MVIINNYHNTHIRIRYNTYFLVHLRPAIWGKN